MCACAWVCKWKSDCVLWQCKRVMCTKGSIWYIKNKMSAWECADVIVSDAFLGTWKYGNLIQQDNKQGSKTLNKAQPAICKPSPTTHNRGTHTLRGSQAPFHIHTPPPPHTNTQASHSRHGLGWQPAWVLYVCRAQPHTHTHTHTHTHAHTHACTHTHMHTHTNFPLTSWPWLAASMSAVRLLC